MINVGKPIQSLVVTNLLERGDIPFCIIREDGIDTEFTYYQFIYESLKKSKEILDLDIGSGDIVLMMKEHSTDLFQTYTGAILIGAVPAIIPHPTTKIDSRVYSENMRLLIGRTQAKAVFMGKRTSHLIFPNADTMREFGIFNLEFKNRSALSVSEIPNPDPNDIATIQHSSGTTGLRKGIPLKHNDITRFLKDYSSQIELSREDRFISWLPLYHDWGLIKFFLLPLLNQNFVYLMSPFDWILDPVSLFEMICKHRGSITGLSNFALNVCTHKIPEGRMDGLDLTTLRYVMLSSEVIRNHSLKTFIERFGKFGLKEGIFACAYGMAENTLLATHTPTNKLIKRLIVDRKLLERTGDVKELNDRNKENAIQLISCGKTFGSNEIRVVDDEDNELNCMQKGSIQCRSDHLFSGYHKRDDLNSKIFTKDGWYRTGDSGFLDEDRELYVLGREDDLIIIGGTNIYPEDIEEIIDRVEGVRKGRNAVVGIYNLTFRNFQIS